MKASGLRITAAALVLFCAANLLASPDEPERITALKPVKTDSPRDTMRSFYEAMNDYRRGVETGNETLQARLDDAVRTMNLEEIPALLREEKGREAAIYLKETIDRVIVLDYERIPVEGTPEAPLLRWRLRDTEIVISRINEGERAGEYLFSSDTVRRAESFYHKVKHLPYLKGSGMGSGFREPFLEKHLPEWSKPRFAFLARWQWIGLALAILLGLFIRTLVRFALDIFLKAAKKTRLARHKDIIEAFRGPSGLIAAVAFWFLCLKILQFDGNALGIFVAALKIILSLSIIWLAYRLTEALTNYLMGFAEKTESTLDDMLVPLLQRTLKILVVILGVLMTIQNLGINVFSLLAGLGIGGLAVALAAKDAVANFFGSLMILFDRPFQVGDWIIVGDAEGTVEEIGFRSTRIRTFYNSVISIPNSELMNAKIDNMGRRQYRRLRTTLGLTYDTPPEKLKAFVDGVKKIILDHPQTRKDYFHVVFNDYGPSSLDIMLYMFFEVPNWTQELLAREEILTQILQLASDIGVDFAFPTRTIHVESLPTSGSESLSTARTPE